MRKPQRAFTLVELLVVIGIIAILIGILIPVVGAVKKAAYAADCRNQIQVIGNAIDRYHTDFLAYPGVFSNADIRAGKTLTAAPAQPGAYPSPVTVSSSENLFLALCGGVTGVGGTNFTVSDFGRGPLSLGNTQKRLPAYIEVNTNSASVMGSTLDDSGYFGIGLQAAATYTGNSATYTQGLPGIPEFIDRFPQGLPIIYMRAQPSRTGVVGVDGTPANTTYQYDARDMLPYIQAGASKYFAFDYDAFPPDANDQADPGGSYPNVFFKGNGSSTPKRGGSYNYFRNANLNAAKRADTYILISPGEDRKYGTSDDICNFSF